MRTFTIPAPSALNYLDALHAAHALMTRQLRMLENNQMHGDNPTTAIRILCEQLEALEALGAKIEEAVYTNE